MMQLNVAVPSGQVIQMGALVKQPSRAPAKMGYLKIKERDRSERPREKLLDHGAASLTDVELLAILIGSGLRNICSIDIAHHILKAFDYDLALLAKQPVSTLQKFDGIGEARAAVLASALELASRRRNTRMSRPLVDTAQLAYEAIYQELYGKITEEFWVLLLTPQHRLIKKCQVSRGGLTRSTVDFRVVFKTILEHNSSHVILVHNHPSGNRSPSEADLSLTKKLIEAAAVLDIVISDHIIFTDDGYLSFVEAGHITPTS